MTTPGTTTTQVEIAGNEARWSANGESRTVQIQALPEAFTAWQIDYKRRIYDAIEKDEYIRFNAGHLPVVGTFDREGLVPNLANKGVGFTPRDEHLPDYVAMVENAVEQIQGLPPHAVDETRALRIATARAVYADPAKLDWRRLGLLEIFEGVTYRNLARYPFASVLWTGDSPVFVSYQADCIVEVIGKDDLRYRFAWAMRRLFEYEPFHVVQTMFPYAYVFWVVGFHDKTPRRRYK